jgi:pimeloyl-ACP methyl ester carboxylesterase
VNATVTIRHNKTELALHRLAPDGSDRTDGPDGSDSPGGSAGRSLLIIHGLGEQSPAAVPAHLGSWPGPVWALDLTGHGASTASVGGGYTCEMLMADVDGALAHIGPATVYGRGLGAYVALLIAGARPDLVRGAILDDGPGLAGGGTEPGTPFVLTEPLAAPGPPDPYALLELSNDVRPPDYAATYARQAATLSGLDTAVVVCAATRPPWLAAVAGEPGVRVLPRDEAVSAFTGAG